MKQRKRILLLHGLNVLPNLSSKGGCRVKNYLQLGSFEKISGGWDNEAWGTENRSVQRSTWGFEYHNNEVSIPDGTFLELPIALISTIYYALQNLGSTSLKQWSLQP